MAQGYQNNMPPANWNPMQWSQQPTSIPSSQPFYQPQFSSPSPSPQPTQMAQMPFTGRFIEKPSEIVPNEVPMDGRPALFPSKNLDEVYLKMWNANGEMKTFRYILDLNQDLNAMTQPQDTTQADILSRLEELEKQVAANAKKGSGQRNNSGGGDK